jgi:hypothetical protein
MSHAQHQFAFDMSRLPKSLTFQETADEARHLTNARMDVSYMFHAAMTLLEFATELDTVSVWQPADPSLSWFDGQVADFAQTCRNKSIKSLIVYPMMLRWKKQEHWNLVKEVTVYDPSFPSSKRLETLHRGERASIPLGLASQYHIHACARCQPRCPDFWIVHTGVGWTCCRCVQSGEGRSTWCRARCKENTRNCNSRTSPKRTFRDPGFLTMLPFLHLRNAQWCEIIKAESSATVVNS